MRPTVLILAKKTDDTMVRYGVSDAHTKDYALARTLRSKLNEEGIEGTICNTDYSAIKSDMEQLQVASALIVVAISPEYLNSARDAIDVFHNATSREVIFLTSLPYPNDLDMFSRSCLSKGIPSQIYTLSNKNNLETFVQDIMQHLQQKKMKKVGAYSDVRGKLKRAMPLPKQPPNVIERTWLVDLLDRWITGSSRMRICWIKGEHGSGKTSFIGDYCAHIKSGNKNDIIGSGIYYCSSTDTRTQDSVRIIQTIAYELCCCMPGYEEVIHDTVMDDHFKDCGPEVMMRELLIDPFSEHSRLLPDQDRYRFVFAIDGIDELKTGKSDALTGFLNLLRHFNHLHPFIRIIITSTPDQDINNALAMINAKRIDLTREYLIYQKEDAEHFLCNELTSRGIPYTQEDVSQILFKSEWNFDYLQHFIAQCDNDNSDKLPPLDLLPTGLLAMYDRDFEQMFSVQYYREKVKPIIQILAAAYEPMTIANITQILKKESNEIEEVVNHSRLTQFLKESKPGNKTAIALYSVSLEKWLCEMDHRFSIDIYAGKAKMVEWIQRGNGGEYIYYSFYNNDYLRKYALHHLLDGRKTDVISDLIRCSNPDDFEKLKSLLGNLFINPDAARRGWDRLLLSLFREKYDYRIRDILIYIYRYILKRKIPKQRVLNKIIELLKINGEEIRAELLLGEGIENYETAHLHFCNTIDRANKLIKEMQAEACVNIWWHVRMSGVACNRLANLESKKHHRENAENFYFQGKQKFETAKQLFHEAPIDQQRVFSEDITIIDRDLGISNERLGDISFESGNHKKAAEYYQQFYEVCDLAYQQHANMRTKWDLSISHLRLGDAECCLGKTVSAQAHYISALGLRREILQHMRSDFMDMLPRPYYVEFDAPDTVDIGTDINTQRFKESRDIDPIRDIAICYARLGDLAFSLDQPDVAAEYYAILVNLCERNHNEMRTAASEHDLSISRARMKRCMMEVQDE